MRTSEFTSVSDRIRTLSDTELSRTIVEYCVGVLTEVLRGSDYAIKPDIKLYTQVLLQQMKEPTCEEPHRYTREEMMEMEGNMVYIHYIGPCHKFYEDTSAPWFASEQCIITTINGSLAKLHMPLDLYDKSWTAYAYKPNDMEIGPCERELADDYQMEGV